MWEGCGHSDPDYGMGSFGYYAGEWFAQFDNSLQNLGHSISDYVYGMGWPAASAGPLDRFKMTVGEGRIRTPMLIAGMVGSNL
jgi:hypothetical protein